MFTTWAWTSRDLRLGSRPHEQARAAQPIFPRGPSFTAPHAEPSPQPSAGARPRRERIRLSYGQRGRRLVQGEGRPPEGQGARRPLESCSATSARQAPGPPTPAAEANARPAGGENRPQGRRRALSLGRKLTREWLRLLRARVL